MFQFKQFTIHQDHTAMKVCTDACVLGAYTSADRLRCSPARVLDIGTGTGLLALMAAQNHPLARVDAVELDTDAVAQAIQNVANSPFADRVRVWHTPIQQFEIDNQYDLILTNPPFFTNHLRSPNPAANRAHHTETLSFADLLLAVDRLLETAGQWWVLLPPNETSQLDQLAGLSGLWPQKRLVLRHNNRKAPFRHVTRYGRQQQQFIQTDTLTIYEPDPAQPTREQYTLAFRQLLAPFYLIF